MNENKFQHEDFTCDVDVFTKRDGLLVRFYDLSTEQEQDDIHDLVIVNPGYGFLSLKFKGDEGLLSGFLDEAVFSAAAVLKAIEFPYINFFWGGTIIMVIGFLLSIFRRNKELKQA